MTNRLLLVLALLVFSLNSYSQAPEKKEKPKDNVSPEERYKKLKALYIKEIDSKTHIVADSLFQVFIYKITPDVEFNELTKQIKSQDYLKWATENISKTEFKDAAEAEKLWTEYKEASTVNVMANQEYYNYLMETFQVERGIEMSSQLYLDVMEEYPGKRRRIKLPKRKKKSDFYPKMPGQ